MISKFSNLFCKIVADYSSQYSTVITANAGITLDEFFNQCDNNIDKYRVMLMIVEKIGSIHQENHLHLDIKAKNIAVTRFYGTPVVTCMKYTFVTFVVLDAESLVPMKNNRKAKAVVFSKPSPPEIEQKQYCTTATDVWLLGQCFSKFLPEDVVSQMMQPEMEKRCSLAKVTEMLQLLANTQP